MYLTRRNQVQSPYKVYQACWVLRLISRRIQVDHTLSKRGSIHPQRLCLCIGAVGSSFHVIYFLCYTLPRWNRLIVAGIAEHEGRYIRDGCFLTARGADFMVWHYGPMVLRARGVPCHVLSQYNATC